MYENLKIKIKRQITFIQKLSIVQPYVKYADFCAETDSPPPTLILNHYCAYPPISMRFQLIENQIR